MSDDVKDFILSRVNRLKYQPELYGLEEAEEARDKAIDKVEANNPYWKNLAVSAIEAVSLGAGIQNYEKGASGTVWTSCFTSDDVLRYEPELEECPEKRVLGAAFRKLSRAKVIEPTGRYVPSRRRSSHCRPKREWRRCFSAKM